MDVVLETGVVYLHSWRRAALDGPLYGVSQSLSLETCSAVCNMHEAGSRQVPLAGKRAGS